MHIWIFAAFLVASPAQFARAAPRPIAATSKIAALTEDAFGAMGMDSDAEELDIVAEVRAALDAGASPNARSQFGGETLLIQAVENNRIGAARLLLARGADVNLADAESGDTPLIRASSTNDWTSDQSRSLTKIVALLLQKRADPNRRNKAGETALTLASIEGRGNVVLQLLRAKADFRATHKNGMTPLQLASIPVQRGSLQIIGAPLPLEVEDANDAEQVRKAIAKQDAMWERVARADEKRLTLGRANARRYLIAAGAKK